MQKVTAYRFKARSMPKSSGGSYGDMILLGASRYLWEYVIRRKTQALPSVHFHAGKVTSVQRSPYNGDLISQVTLETGEAIEGDFFVIASGRTSQFHKTLERDAAISIRVETIDPCISYMTAVYRNPSNSPLISMCIPSRQCTKLALVFPIENNNAMLCLTGYGSYEIGNIACELTSLQQMIFRVMMQMT
jgi:hypothetical protein